MFSTMDDDGDEKDDSKRKTRNLSEKKRRDQFNTLVNELSAMVSANSRKMDKSSVLRSTISFLKKYNAEVSTRSKVHDIQEDWKPAFLANEEFMHLIFEAFDGFIVVFASCGRILYTSGNITSLLGYLPSDVLNTSIYDMLIESDHSDLYGLLSNPPAVIDPVQEALLAENRVSFRCHMKRGGLNYRDVVVYEDVQLNGYFRVQVKYEKNDEPHRNELHKVSETDSKYIFVGTTRIRKPKLIREMSFNGINPNEFSSRHSLEWKFLFLDHRAPPIIGYLPFEVLGTSGYDYYHFDDLEQVAQCHESLKLKGEGTSCYYRFLTKGQQWMWLRTRYYITYHQWTYKPEFVMCVHRVINYMDVVQQMRRNNGRVEYGEDVDNSADSVERQLNTSASSMMITSPWSSQSSRSRLDGRPMTPSSSHFRHRYGTYHGSSVSESTTLNEIDPVASHTPHFVQYDAHLPLKSSPHSTPSVSSMHTNSTNALQPVANSSVTGDQYVTFSIPDEPTPLLPTSYSSPLLLNETASNADETDSVQSDAMLEDQLQRKHEELQLMIGHQQDELRRVSEQLVLARYGHSPTVSADVITMARNAPSASESTRYSPVNTSDRFNNEQCQHQHHQHLQLQRHHRQQHHQHHHHHHHHHQPQQLPQSQELQPQHEYNVDVRTNSNESSIIAEKDHEVLSYMQLEPITTSHPNQYAHHALQVQHQHHQLQLQQQQPDSQSHPHQQHQYQHQYQHQHQHQHQNAHQQQHDIPHDVAVHDPNVSDGHSDSLLKQQIQQPRSQD